MDVVTSFPTFFVEYVQTLLVSPNFIYAGVIALFFGIVTARLPGLFFVPVVAAIVYLAALTVVPSLINHADIVMPAFDLELAKKGVALYVVFLVADSVVFGIKKAVMAIFGW